MDGTGHYVRHPMCGEGRDMTVEIDTNVAYVKFQTDGENKYSGYRGFYATFNAEGPSTTYSTCIVNTPGNYIPESLFESDVICYFTHWFLQTSMSVKRIMEGALRTVTT